MQSLINRGFSSPIRAWEMAAKGHFSRFCSPSLMFLFQPVAACTTGAYLAFVFAPRGGLLIL